MKHDRYKFRGYRAVLRWLCVVAALVGVSVANAQALPGYTPTPTGGVLHPGGLNSVGDAFRDWAANDAGDVMTRDKIRVPVGAANADMFANRRIPWASVLGVGFRVASGLGTAALLYDLYNNLRCKPDGTGFLCDVGVSASSGEPQNKIQYCLASWACVSGPQSDFAALCKRSQEIAFPGGRVELWGMHCHAWKANGDYGNGSGYTVVGTVPGEQSCPSGPVGPDGKCAGGESQSMTPDQLADKALPYADQYKPRAADIAKQAVGQGHDLTPYAQPQPATGPATLSQPDKQVVTQQPNGTTSVTTITTTNNITYQGDTYNITTTTVKNNPDGSKETTTEAQTDQDVCAKRPNSAACVDLGSPDQVKVESLTKDVSFSPVQFAEAGSCPAPVSFSVYGRSLAFSFDAACEQAQGVIRAVVLLAASFLAAWIFVDGLKS